MSVRNKLIFLSLFHVSFSSDFLTFGRVGRYTCPHARPSGVEFPWRYYVASRSETGLWTVQPSWASVDIPAMTTTFFGVFLSGPAEAAETSTNHGEARTTGWLFGQPGEGGSDCGRAVKSVRFLAGRLGVQA